MLTFGSQGSYQWIVTDNQRIDLLQICPEIVLGKYIAVTSIDSGALVPNDKEKALGWKNQGDIAYSPRIERTEDLPREGWDEWYVFANHAHLGTSHLNGNIFEVPDEPGQVRVFVNYCFGPHLAEMNHLAILFWRQLERIRPESYLAENDYLTFVTQNANLFAVVRDGLEKSVTP
ncbi:MAG TPA: hypothetical protein VJ731_16555 [Terriglobales bacterium]|nr:hypothetical protein [Terriglobales bacterium]